MTTTYVAMSPNYWGKGETPEAAKRELRAAGGTLSRYVLYRLPDGATDVGVDGMGQIRWLWDEDYTGPRAVELEVVERRGAK